MKYSFIEIRPTPKYAEQPWSVSFYNVEGDLESKKSYTPHNLGFFYFPAKWGREKAFEILKEDMIRRRQEHITLLNKDLQELKNLQLPDWVKKQ